MCVILPALADAVEPFAFVLEVPRAGDRVFLTGELLCQGCEEHGHAVEFGGTVTDDLGLEARVIGVLNLLSDRYLALGE